MEACGMSEVTSPDLSSVLLASLPDCHPAGLEELHEREHGTGEGALGVPWG